ncbi:uncharacterized protein BO80DRAFT_432951 [Aspergillus ibericus CBS 121593]|uniref:Uncharacterized protein n=1 Tax=Aspergillus ibericus CBS 121593 TaxID=1448316 RepID=A0A395H8G5_9EURO|nr:hypothetical protein BO80DRAFT_432951 [Aspergillus ibericus CBS 121593]RAL03168.1 hypothetical protein BO80DRAFT_432951 [Aspergillus ibericus CBS 121593]
MPVDYECTFYGNRERSTPLSYALASEISEILRDARVPCLLIEDLMFRVLGIDGCNKHLDLALEDSHLDYAIDILRGEGFDDKTYPNCSTLLDELDKAGEAHFQPAHWFHLCDRTPLPRRIPPDSMGSAHPDDDEKAHVDLRLYRMSEYFWALPELPPVRSLLTTGDYIWTHDHRLPAHYLGTDPSQNSGLFPPDIPPVLIPSPARVIESLIRLKARDSKRPCRGRFWHLRLAYFMTVGRSEIAPGRAPPIGGALYEPDAFDGWQ